MCLHYKLLPPFSNLLLFATALLQFCQLFTTSPLYHLKIGSISFSSSFVKHQSHHLVRCHVYLTGEETLPLDQCRMIEQAKFTYSPVRRAFKKQTKQLKIKGEKKILFWIKKRSELNWWW